MNCSMVHSCGLYGITGVLVEIEVAIMPGLPSFDIVGLGDSAVRESRDRVHAAICNAGFRFPAGRLIASYAPAWLRKEGSAFDLPLALAILAASGQIKLPGEKVCVIGELGLNGAVRPVPGVFCRALSCRDQNIGYLLVPAANQPEAGALLGRGAIAIKNLRQAVALLTRPVAQWHGLCGGRTGQINSTYAAYASAAANQDRHLKQGETPDIGRVVGQDAAVRALLIAAAGCHNLLLLGSPGCGKTTLAESLPGLLPELSKEEAIEVTRIYSASGLLPEQSSLIRERPFRCPHHALTRAAMIGGGAFPRPGEVSLAHKGVLFLDEMTAFSPDVLDLLRQPLETARVCLNRLSHRMVYPADILLVGAANPCRCGEYLEPQSTCRCTPEKVREHLGRLSGPLLDRMDLTTEMTRLSAEQLAESVRPERAGDRRSDRLREQVQACWQRQDERCRLTGRPFTPNGRYRGPGLVEDLQIAPSAAGYAAHAAHALNLSARGYHKVLRVARTIADLEGDGQVGKSHVGEALQYRLRLAER